MLVVVPFAQCIARPDIGDKRFGLSEHLEAVANGCGGPVGGAEEKLSFLAGLLHDAAKAAPEWQKYIRDPRIKKGPPHSPLGAALFAYWADDLSRQWAGADRKVRRCLADLALDWTRVVYDHHSGIDDLTEEPPWEESLGGVGLADLFDTLEHKELVAFVRRFFPEARDLADFSKWLATIPNQWRRALQSVRPDLLAEIRKSRPGDDVPLASEGLRLAKLGAVLIFADRSHAADWLPESYESAAADAAVETLEETLKRMAKEAIADKVAPALVELRGRLNATALEGYRANADASIFALLLPTGFGKTLAGLRVALEACRSGRCRRIIYVAPYLSILSQAAREIGTATGQEVFVHHHLTAATLEDHQPYDSIDTWQSPILATTFNQLFRTLFPARAQQCLRRPALEKAFVFIDEPQIIGAEVWNLFLRALAVTCREQHCQVLLTTATLPPAEIGLGDRPVELVPRSEVRTLPTDRYTIHLAPDLWDAQLTAEEAIGRLNREGSTAVILNTVRDACDVYQRVKGADRPWRFLSAAMLPSHKARVIAEVQTLLDPKNPQLIGVVCTQVLEAGVDLSFRSLLRALPVFPSVIQAAGRANRHGGSSAPAEVVVFDYRREDGRPSREYIYKSGNARRHTDDLLKQRCPLSERDVPEALDEYFRRLWSSEPSTACLQRFEKAAKGAWSELAGLEPFDGDDGWRVDVFVPIANPEDYLNPALDGLMKRFAPGGTR